MRRISRRSFLAGSSALAVAGPARAGKLAYYDIVPRVVHANNVVKCGETPFKGWKLLSAADPSAVPFSAYFAPIYGLEPTARRAMFQLYFIPYDTGDGNHGINSTVRPVSFHYDPVTNDKVWDRTWPTVVIPPDRVGLVTSFAIAPPDGSMTAKWNAIWSDPAVNNLIHQFSLEVSGRIDLYGARIEVLDRKDAP